MGFKSSKTDRLFWMFAVSMMITSAHAQKLFYGDSTFNATLRQYEGVTNFFYDFEIDSIGVYGVYDSSMSKLLIVAPVDEYGKISGRVKMYRSDKTLRFEAEYQNGMAHGRVIQYDMLRNDTAGIYNYVNGRKDGMQYYFLRGSFSGGTPPPEGFLSILSGLYSNGKPDGPWREIREDGNIIYYCHYVNGLKEGIEYDAYDNGQISICVVYRAGKVLDGIYRYYDYDGNLESFYLEYSNGVMKYRKW